MWLVEYLYHIVVFVCIVESLLIHMPILCTGIYDSMICAQGIVWELTLNAKEKTVYREIQVHRLPYRINMDHIIRFGDIYLGGLIKHLTNYHTHTLIRLLPGS